MYQLKFYERDKLIQALDAVGEDEAIPDTEGLTTVYCRYDLDRKALDSGDYDRGYINNGLTIKNLTAADFAGVFRHLEDCFRRAPEDIRLDVSKDETTVLAGKVDGMSYRMNFCTEGPVELIYLRGVW